MMRGMKIERGIMSEKSFKESLRNKATKLLAGLSLFSHTAYGQPEAKNDEPEKEKTENVSSSSKKILR